MPSKDVPRRSAIKDPVNPHFMSQSAFPYCCEQCCHFIPDQILCAAGIFTPPHRKQALDRSFSMSGRMALCRFLEID